MNDGFKSNDEQKQDKQIHLYILGVLVCMCVLLLLLEYSLLQQQQQQKIRREIYHT